MMGRRLNQQQRLRIGAIQQRRLQQAAESAEQQLRQDPGQQQSGRVISRFGRNLIIEDAQGQLVPCLLRQNIGQAVCGDRVAWQATGDRQGVVSAIEARRSVLIRPNYSGQERPLAANIDRMIIVLAPEPAPRRYLLDQYLIAARLLCIEALICLNKTDLLDAAGEASFSQEFGDYPAIGYPLIRVSARQEQGLAPLLDAVRGRTAILLGQSGVGKSSLASALLPDREIQTGRLSAFSGKGCHTTTTTCLYHLPQGGELIDSPGVRSFRPTVKDRSDLECGFREFAPYLGHCRFSNCQHRGEPQCALQQAVEQGQIDPRRLANFRHMAAGLG
ncbi:MAG: small ribosomal subunit biogenesis GTPase RsgA [Gammaproteobacteria bacterium SHHR-1]|nr:small ribosomal subunit biogenesis GTPase RsgA [gamma proteobacterium SS-5]